MICPVVNGQRRVYCVECADTNPDVQAIIERASLEERLEIFDDLAGAEDEKCVGCGRSIGEVPAYQRTYRVKVRITFEVEVDLQAASATQAQFLTSEALGTATFVKGQREIKHTLEEVPMAEEARVDDHCLYQVELGEVVPPDQDLFSLTGRSPF
jgi:hypothetical protein